MTKEGSETLNSETVNSPCPDKAHILIIPMGGTICSFADNSGIRSLNCKNALSKLTAHFETASEFRSAIGFRIKHLKQEFLSENVTVSVWNKLLNVFKSEDVFVPDCKGIILLHGTDTLAYTSSLLAAVLEGTPIPVFTVAAHLPLENEGSNGFANFKAAAELIANGIAPNVYTVYRNVKDDEVTPDELLLHLGRELVQCEAPDCNFHSKGELVLTETSVSPFVQPPPKTNAFMLDRLTKLKEGVLLIKPYPGLDYSKLNLDGVKAVVHGTYHSGTVCVDDEKSPFSVIAFLKNLSRLEIPLLISPCDSRKCAYESAHTALRSGAFITGGLSLEHAYARTLLAVSLGFSGNEIPRFVNSGNVL